MKDGTSPEMCTTRSLCFIAALTGIALFDELEEHQAYSANVAYELGMMHQQQKHCLVLRHTSLPPVPFDLLKELYVPYERDLQVRGIVERWVNDVVARKD